MRTLSKVMIDENIFQSDDFLKWNNLWIIKSIFWGWYPQSCATYLHLLNEDSRGHDPPDFKSDWRLWPPAHANTRPTNNAIQFVVFIFTIRIPSSGTSSGISSSSTIRLLGHKLHYQASQSSIANLRHKTTVAKSLLSGAANVDKAENCQTYLL